MELLTYSSEKISQLDTSFRRNLINDISGFKSPQLIGSINSAGISNLGIFNSIVHIGANPPLLGFIMRPLTVSRHTYENIKSTGFFTMNAITEDLKERAHQTSGKYDKNVSEFIMAGIKPSYSEKHPAPYVAESPIQIGLKIEEEHLIKSNETRLMVGRIIEIKIQDRLLDKKGHIDLKKPKVICVQGLDYYYSVQTGVRLDRITKDELKIN